MKVHKTVRHSVRMCNTELFWILKYMHIQFGWHFKQKKDLKNNIYQWNLILTVVPCNQRKIESASNKLATSLVIHNNQIFCKQKGRPSSAFSLQYHNNIHFSSALKRMAWWETNGFAFGVLFMIGLNSFYTVFPGWNFCRLVIIFREYLIAAQYSYIDT